MYSRLILVRDNKMKCVCCQVLNDKTRHPILLNMLLFMTEIHYRNSWREAIGIPTNNTDFAWANIHNYCIGLKEISTNSRSDSYFALHKTPPPSNMYNVI